MFDVFTGWLKDYLNGLFKPVAVAAAIAVSSPAVASPLKFKNLAWYGEHKDFQEWDSIVRELVEASRLPDLAPSDVIALFPIYKTSRLERVHFWCQLLSIMAKYESGFDPLQYYTEDFNDSKGNKIISRGLLQISIESANAYGAELTNAEQLHDVRTNLRCAILILDRWVSRDLVLASGIVGNWRGGARYWSVLRDSSKSKSKILSYLKEIYAPKFAKPSVEVIREGIVFCFALNDGQRETHGKNRSPVIDSILKRVSSSMGNPYCAAAIWCALDDACKELSLTNPVKPTASSQSLFTSAPSQYQKQEHGKKSDGFILRSRNDPSRGHAGLLRDNQTNLKTFPTIEANTNAEGSRDGDGWYKKTRSVDGDASKSFRGFVDFAQWIWDVNNG